MSIPQSIASAVRRLTLAISRGRITQSDDTGVIQMVQVKLNALEFPDLRRVAEYGFASWPPDGCDAMVVFISGDRSNGAVIATHDLKSRFKLGNKGEVALFDNSGAGGAPGKWIWAKKAAGDGSGGGWEIEAKNEPIIINNAKKVTVNAGTDGVVLNTTGHVTLNMGGKNLVVNNPGAVQLTGAGGRKVVCDGDAVVAGVCRASAGQKVTAT